MIKADKLRAEGVNLVDFGAGEPDFPTPERIKRAAIEALNENFTKYTPTGGTRDLKRAVIERHAKDFGSTYTPEECLVTVGGKHAIFEAMASTLNAGDEVILPIPYWVTFLDVINYCGGKPVLLETKEDEGFAVHSEAVEKLVTARTRIIVLNSPSNPSGAVIPREELEKILEIATRRQVLVMADETYCHFLYRGKAYSLGATGNRDNLIVIGSLSKTYAMTGWRVGFALGSAKLVANMLKLQSHSTSNPTSFAQKGAVEALQGPQDSVREMLAEYRRRRDRIVNGLRSIPGVCCTMPEGAFYAYPNVGSFLKNNGLANVTALSEKLLDEAHVAVVPGPAFGTQEHIRISYATSQEQIDEGLRRMKDFFARR